MWNIYGAFQLVYTERWKRLPNLGFKKEEENKEKHDGGKKKNTRLGLSCLA